MDLIGPSAEPIGPHQALTELNGPHRKWNKQLENFRITHPHVKIIKQQIADNRNRTITMPVSADCYLLCIMMALHTEIIYFLNLNGRNKFVFYSYICKLGKHAGSIV